MKKLYNFLYKSLENLEVYELDEISEIQKNTTFHKNIQNTDKNIQNISLPELNFSSMNSSKRNFGMNPMQEYNINDQNVNHK